MLSIYSLEYYKNYKCAYRFCSEHFMVTTRMQEQLYQLDLRPKSEHHRNTELVSFLLSVFHIDHKSHSSQTEVVLLISITVGIFKH